MTFAVGSLVKARGREVGRATRIRNGFAGPAASRGQRG